MSSAEETLTIPPLVLNSTDDAAAESKHGSPLEGRRCLLSRAADPWAKWVREWNRVYLLACAAGLMVDPLFLYALSISGPLMCVFVDGWFTATVTVLRCMVDALHVWNICVQLRMARGASRVASGDSEVEAGTTPNGRGKAAQSASYLKSKKGLVLDLFVILPVLQVVMWVAAPALIRRGSTTAVMTLLLIMFLFEYLPKIYHSVCFLRRMQNFSGYIFGTIWWGIALNLMAYFVASHAVGACWYLLGIQRATKCLREQCLVASGCGAKTVACVDPIYYGTTTSIRGERLSWARNMQARAMCLRSSDNYQYGAYKWTVQLVTNPNRVEKILLPIFWGLMTLSTFGNLESTTEWIEIVFNIITITGGLLLVTMLIGNIKVFLHATTSKKQAMHLRLRSVEWWMKRKHLPQGFRQRVRQYERQRWAAMRGVDECEMIRNLPEGLRRDIKYHLCLDLVRQVPLFQHMDEVVLENICDRVKSLIFPKGEIVTIRINYYKRRGPSAEDAVYSERPFTEQPSPPGRRQELLHARPGQLQRRRAPLLVPPPPLRGAPPAFFFHSGDARDYRSIRLGSERREVRDAALSVHVCEREGEAERAILLAWVADVGGGGDPTGVAEIQAQEDAHLAVVHTATAAAFKVLVSRGGEAKAVHGTPHFSEAESG